MIVLYSPRSHRYRLTDVGLRYAMLLSHLRIGCYFQAWRNSSTSTRPSPALCASPPAITAELSINSPAGRTRRIT
jgi:hypothetical protein